MGELDLFTLHDGCDVRKGYQIRGFQHRLKMLKKRTAFISILETMN